jgi:deoxyhypusine monooxygenase
MWEAPPFDKLTETIRSASHPIGMRMRAAYFLRTAYATATANAEDTTAAAVVDALSDGLRDARHGSLMRHEFAYVLGQLRDELSCAVLEETLLNPRDCVMVRHEAAEALGAIGADRSRIILECVRDENAAVPELAETCQIALDVMAWRQEGGDPDTMPAACACMLNPYSSVDPAPPHPSHANKSMEELGSILCDAALPIFERYRAMFSLRNAGGADAVAQLCRALVHDTSSALLRHEVAYVLGQMQHVDSIEALAESLRRPDEHSMVRHESAEALGAIEGQWDEVENILTEFCKDEDDVVRESCLVALDAADYWGHGPSNEGADEASPSTFAGQKAEPHHVLANHFNVAL